jgi:hypothetical protein
MSRIKEPHFFSRGGVPGIPSIKDERRYLRMFRGAADVTYRGEASVSYLWDERSAAAIMRSSPDARILISLREPVERAFSNYWLYVHLGFERRTFRAAVEAELDRRVDPAAVPPPYLARGLYAEQVARYLELFEHVHVLFFEDLAADVRQTMRNIFGFLGLDPCPGDDVDSSPHNTFRVGRSPGTRWALHAVRRSGLVRTIPFALRFHVSRALTTPQAKPELEPELATLLRRFYAEPNDRLRALLGRPLAWDST